MDVVPLHRRPSLLAAVGLVITSSVYYWALRIAEEFTIPRTMLAYLLIIMGLASVIGFFIFIANLLFWIREPKGTIAAFMRLIILVAWIPTSIYVLSGGGASISFTVLTHLSLGLVTLLLTVSLTAQFVLPVNSLNQRIAVIRRLMGFLVGERGPVTFVRNGEAEEAHGERMRRAPGVFLIDYASAVVLRTDTKFTRPAGPGVVFTTRGEWRAESLDLRRQVRSVRGSTPPAGEPAELNEVNSLAITRDGIPISTDLDVTFMLDPGHTDEPHEGREASQPPYDFNKTAVGKAVYGHAFSEFEDLPWTKLPLRLTVDLWREMVKEKTLRELVSKDKVTVAPLQMLKDQIQVRLTSPTVETRGPNGKRHIETSREYDILRSRGVRVLNVGGMTSLYLPNEVQRERLLRWREAWAGGVQAVLVEANEEVKHARHRGEAEACATLIRDLTAELRQKLGAGNPPNTRDTLKGIIDDAIRLCSQRGLVADGANLVIQLNQIHDELSKLDDSCMETSTGGAI